MSNQGLGWVWSEERRMYYMQIKDDAGNWQYHWHNPFGQNVQNEQSEHSRNDSVMQGKTRSEGHATPSHGVPLQTSAVASSIPSERSNETFRRVGPAIEGSGNGNHEPLDHSYYVRPSSFFSPGRVFSILFTEAAGSTTANWNDDDISYVKYGEQVYSQIRRFVVVRQRKEFCYCCPIVTYSGRATLKPGVNPGEHAIIHTKGYAPELLQGETGIYKAPICVLPSYSQVPFNKASRIQFGIQHPVQYNVKAKDLGTVVQDSIPKLVGHWQQEQQQGHLTLSGDASASNQLSLTSGYAPQPYSGMTSDITSSAYSHNPDSYYQPGANTQYQAPQDSIRNVTQNSTVQNSGAMEVSVIKVSTISGALDSRYEFISNPSYFFKKGKVFKMLWAEPRGYSEEERQQAPVTEQIFSEIAHFIVVRAKGKHCLCFRIHTYSGQATAKPGVVGKDHAAVIPEGGAVQLHPTEQSLKKAAIEVRLENSSPLDPMSRVNCAKLYTIEYNVRVCKIGRVVGPSLDLLDIYLAESLNLVSPRALEQAVMASDEHIDTTMPGYL